MDDIDMSELEGGSEGGGGVIFENSTDLDRSRFMILESRLR